MQGMYSTYYGPHGMEFLHITYGDMNLPLANLLPHGKCFAGLKVLYSLPAHALYGFPGCQACRYAYMMSRDGYPRALQCS